MDTNLSYTHWPGAVANAKLQVLVVGFDIFLHHAILDNQVEGVEDILGQLLFL